MKAFFDKTFKTFFIITGIGTAAAGLNAFLPKFTVETVQKLAFVPEYTIFVQHWGMMVFLMGLAMTAAALIPAWRMPILIYSAIEKAFMVFLVASNASHPFAQGFYAPAVMDAVVVLYSILYFLNLRSTNPTIHTGSVSPQLT